MSANIPAKHIYLANRNPRLTSREFADRWRQPSRMGEMLDLAEVAALRYCLACEPASILSSATDEYDGIALLALRSLPSIPVVDRLLATNEVAYADELRTFARPVEDVSWYVASELLVAGHETDVVVFDLGRRRADLRPGEALRGADQARQRDLADSGLFDLGLRRWVRNVLVASPARGYGYDTLDEFWFDSLDAVASASDGLELLFDRSSAFTERRTSIVLVTTVIHRIGLDRP
jgi:hypothetical protein